MMVRKLDHCSVLIVSMKVLSTYVNVMESTCKMFLEYLSGVLAVSIDISISMRDLDLLLKYRVTLQASGKEGI